MKKQIAAASILLASAGGGGYQVFHRGGIYNPHVVEITEKVWAETATDTVRYCTFKPKAPFDIAKGDYLSIFLPGNKETKFKVLESTRVENVFAKCNKADIDLSKIALSMTEKKSLLEVCAPEQENCQATEVADPKGYINKLVKKKGK